jgi:hypothetical protein
MNNWTKITQDQVAVHVKAQSHKQLYSRKLRRDYNTVGTSSKLTYSAFLKLPNLMCNGCKLQL